MGNFDSHRERRSSEFLREREEKKKKGRTQVGRGCRTEILLSRGIPYSRRSSSYFLSILIAIASRHRVYLCNYVYAVASTISTSTAHIRSVTLETAQPSLQARGIIPWAETSASHSRTRGNTKLQHAQCIANSRSNGHPNRCTAQHARCCFTTSCQSSQCSARPRRCARAQSTRMGTDGHGGRGSAAGIGGVGALSEGGRACHSARHLHLRARGGHVAIRASRRSVRS